MTKFYGLVGFAETFEDDLGVWREHIKARPYYGEYVRHYHRWETTSNANDDLSLSSSISIVADSFAMENMHLIRWVEIYGEHWKVIGIDPKYPRIELTIGGVYNGDEDSEVTASDFSQPFRKF